MIWMPLGMFVPPTKKYCLINNAPFGATFGYQHVETNVLEAASNHNPHVGAVSTTFDQYIGKCELLHLNTNYYKPLLVPVALEKGQKCESGGGGVSVHAI